MVFCYPRFIPARRLVFVSELQYYYFCIPILILLLSAAFGWLILSNIVVVVALSCAHHRNTILGHVLLMSSTTARFCRERCFSLYILPLTKVITQRLGYSFINLQIYQQHTSGVLCLYMYVLYVVQNNKSVVRGSAAFDGDLYC